MSDEGEGDNFVPYEIMLRLRNHILGAAVYGSFYFLSNVVVYNNSSSNYYYHHYYYEGVLISP